MRKKLKEFVININGKRHDTDNQVITEEIVKLSGVTDKKKPDYVLFFNASSKPQRGLLSRGKRVILSRPHPTSFQVVLN